MVMQGGRRAVAAEHFRVFSAVNIHWPRFRLQHRRKALAFPSHSLLSYTHGETFGCSIWLVHSDGRVSKRSVEFFLQIQKFTKFDEV